MTAGRVLNLNALLPPTLQRRYRAYEGSLTTPPCSEGLLWHGEWSSIKTTRLPCGTLVLRIATAMAALGSGYLPCCPAGVAMVQPCHTRTDATHALAVFSEPITISLAQMRQYQRAVGLKEW